MQENISVLFREDEVNRRIADVAAQINADYTGQEIHLISILAGAMFFTCELAKHISVPMTLDMFRVSSYGAETKSCGRVTSIMGLTKPITGRHVIIVEDIIDTGHTMQHLKNLFLEQKPASLKVCTLLDKPSRRQVDNIQPDYYGYKIDDLFVVGYGMDYNEKYRNLRYIGVLNLK